MHSSLLAASAGRALLLLFCTLLGAVVQPRAFGVQATDDVANVSPCELESIINQLVNPSPEYQLHASALRNQLKDLLRERQLAVGEEQAIGDYPDYTDEDKRSVAALAAQGLLHQGAKRGLAVLAKNGQLPTRDPADYIDPLGDQVEQKRYVGALARSGGFMGYGKRNVGTLARDFQLPNGKRNLATMARLGMLGTPSSHPSPKRNVAAVARYNSQHRNDAAAAAEKRSLAALKGSPVHGGQQKREDEEVILPAIEPRSYDYVDYSWLYPSYADLDWGDFGRAQKRFLDTSKDPELFGIEHAANNQPEYDEQKPMQSQSQSLSQPHEQDEQDAVAITENANVGDDELLPAQPKRHIGAVYRSGFLPTYRYLRSTTGSDLGYGGSNVGGRFSRSGRARQFVEFYPPHERLRQPIAAVCKRCFLPNRPMMNWNGGAGVRGRLPKYFDSLPAAAAQHQQQQHHYQQDTARSINTNSLPTSSFHTWGTPPRITALHRREFRRNGPLQNYQY